jgi:hypothetical protein
MTAVHGKETQVVGGRINFSPFLNATDSSQDIDMAETTAYGNESKTYIPGLDDGQFTFAGMWDQTADDEMATQFKSAGDVWQYGYGGLAVGNAGLATLGKRQSYTASSPVGDVVTMAITVQADGGLESVEVLHAIDAAESSAGNETSVDSGASSANGGAAYLNLISFTGTSITVNVAHSTDDAVFNDIATFTAATTEGSERVIVAEGTTINRYLRAEWAGTFTSATFAVSFARR